MFRELDSSGFSVRHSLLFSALESTEELLDCVCLSNSPTPVDNISLECYYPGGKIVDYRGLYFACCGRICWGYYYI